MLLVAVIAAISFTSCKKECTCTVTTTSPFIQNIPPTTISAEGEDCDAAEATIQQGEMTITTVCD